MGNNALARFDRDVLDQAHAETVVQDGGINDIGWPGTILVPKGERAPSADDVIVGYQQLITRARTHGMRIVGATLTLTRHRHLEPLAAGLGNRGAPCVGGFLETACATGAP